MTVKGRIVSIRLMEKANRLPVYAKQIGLTINSLDVEKKGPQLKDE